MLKDLNKCIAELQYYCPGIVQFCTGLLPNLPPPKKNLMYEVLSDYIVIDIEIYHVLTFKL